MLETTWTDLFWTSGVQCFYLLRVVSGSDSVLCVTNGPTPTTIEAARKLLRPSAIRRGLVPAWLGRPARCYCVRHFGRPSPAPAMRAVEMVVAHTKLDNSSWFDHWGTAYDGTFVAEPYRFDSSTAKSLDAFCAALGLAWCVSSNTWWYPGSTIRIIIQPKKL